MDSEWASGISSVNVDLLGIPLTWIICGLGLSKEQSGKNFDKILDTEIFHRTIKD